MQFNFFNKRNDYVESDGPVRYLDASGLQRPLDMPRSQLAIMGLFVTAAAVIGGFMLFNVLDEVQGKAARAQASVEQNLAREVTYDLPVLPSVIQNGDNASIKQGFVDAGATIYDTTSEEEAAAGNMDIIKLPSDVSELDAGVLYSKGVANLSAAEAALLLNGSWTLEVDRSEGVSMRVTYADFTSGTVEAAVQAAIASEGFDPATTPEGGAGVDEVGNTFQTGTVDVGGTVYTWKVSAIALSSVYDISGLPDTAVYVGVRLTL